MLLALAAVALLGPASADARRVRAFAVGPKFDLRWVASPDAFAAKLGALLDRRRRGAGQRAVQRGADDVASHLLGPSDLRRPAATARDLVVLPEDLGLFAALGARRSARAALSSVPSHSPVRSPGRACPGGRWCYGVAVRPMRDDDPPRSSGEHAAALPAAPA